MTSLTLNRVSARCQTYKGKQQIATLLAKHVPLDVLQEACRIAHANKARDAGQHDQFNLGHLKP